MVFADYNDMAARLDDPNLEVTPDSVIVLKHAGPQGGPGMPEWGMLPIPKKLLKQGVRDMLRISDARMSGTSYGACVLHVSPEAYIGGPLAAVRTGDIIAIGEVVRDLHRADSQPEQSYSERQLYEAALDRMAREIAAVKKITETEAIREIEAMLAKGPRRGAPAEADAEAETGTEAKAEAGTGGEARDEAA